MKWSTTIYNQRACFAEREYINKYMNSLKCFMFLLNLHLLRKAPGGSAPLLEGRPDSGTDQQHQTKTDQQHAHIRRNRPELGLSSEDSAERECLRAQYLDTRWPVLSLLSFVSVEPGHSSRSLNQIEGFCYRSAGRSAQALRL